MGFRFRRTLSIAPGLRLNISKSGFSTSAGVRGAHFTVGHGQVRGTVGMPGTGLSYTAVSRVGASRGNSGSVADAILATIWVVRYLPLIGLYGAFIYLSYRPIKDWHPVFIAFMLVSLTWTFFKGLRQLARSVSRDAAALMGAVLYGAGTVALKVVSLPDLDWTWTASLAVVCAVIGAWSCASCHAAIAPMPAAALPQVPTEGSTPEAGHVDEVSTPTKEEQHTVTIAGNTPEISEYQVMVAARLRERGWDTRVVTATNVQGVVMAEYREKKVVISCAPASAPLSDEGVNRIYEYRCEHGADYAAIVSTASYTSSQLRLALATRVLLMQPDQLDQLENSIFGTEALAPQKIFRAEAE
jgi:hypothetical protein